jgi:alpha/beta superfamily hydrolase
VTTTLRPPEVEQLSIAGPAGSLQALIETPPAATAGAETNDAGAIAHFAVICHPHPLYGGSLVNKVVHTLARSFQELGAATIRFNFRGVGASEGAYDHGEGETDDALAAVAYGRQRWPGAALWLAGFSFGGAVAIRAESRARPERLIAVAPGVTLLDVGSVSPACPWLIVQGEADDVIEPRCVLDWAAKLAPRPEVSVLSGAGHFFHGHLHELKQAVLGFMGAAP